MIPESGRIPSVAAALRLRPNLESQASLFGDLMESVLKRDAGVKDSGEARFCAEEGTLGCMVPNLKTRLNPHLTISAQLLPGHGGLLDRFDSYMFTGAMVYFAVKLVAL